MEENVVPSTDLASVHQVSQAIIAKSGVMLGNGETTAKNAASVDPEAEGAIKNLEPVSARLGDTESIAICTVQDLPTERDAFPDVTVTVANREDVTV